MMKRLFVAIDFADSIKAQLESLCTGLVGAKWVTRPQMHLTLRFIGDANEKQQHDIETGLAHVHSAPFNLTLKGTGQFPPKGKPRVIWAGIEAEQPLFQLQRSVEQVTQACGFEPADRAFSAHVTLARLREAPAKEQVDAYLSRQQTFKTKSFKVERFVLYSSQLTPRGSIYHQERFYPFT